MNEKVSIIVPVYNERESLEPFVKALFQALEPTGEEFEVLFIDDGSRDNTFKIIDKLNKKDRRVRGIKFLRNFKKSAAYMAGFQASKGDIIITMDGDLQDDPHEIPRLIEAIKDYYLVVGWKYERKDPLARRATSKVFNFLPGAWTGRRVASILEGEKKKE